MSGQRGQRCSRGGVQPPRRWARAWSVGVTATAAAAAANEMGECAGGDKDDASLVEDGHEDWRCCW